MLELLRSANMLRGMFVEIFSEVEEPRVERTKKHLLIDILGLALFAVLAGAQSFTEIEDFCEHHEEWLKKYFTLPHGIPSHDTFSRVFALLDPEVFQQCFLAWLKTIDLQKNNLEIFV
jgi:DDE_Tnp_1-associated